MDIHNYRRKIERTRERVMDSDISKDNKRLIETFYNNLFTEGLSLSKIERYVYDIFNFAKMINIPLLEAQKEDIRAIISKIEQKEWSPHTKHHFKVAIRKFYKSIEGPEEKGIYPERIKWLHSTIKHSNEKTPSELVTEEDIKKMIVHSKSSRDRALIAVLYESGCRISELGLLKIKDITFDQYGSVINVAGKTGVRRVRLVTSAPYLQEWINKHEYNEIPDYYVWVANTRGKILTYNRLADIVKDCAKAVGIKKRIHPHLFRHSRATLLASKLTEAQMKQYMGWTQSSKMAAVYVHLSGRDTDNAILGLNGIKIQEEKKLVEELKPKNCIRCRKTYSATTKFCEQCGLILDEEEARKFIQAEMERSQMEGVMTKMFQNKDLLKIFLDKMGDIAPSEEIIKIN